MLCSVYSLLLAVNSIVQLLRRMQRKGLKWLEVTAAAQAAFNAEVQQRLKGSVWLSGGCSSWYLNKDGESSSGEGAWFCFCWHPSSF
jgi:hypothetical protein